MVLNFQLLVDVTFTEGWVRVYVGESHYWFYGLFSLINKTGSKRHKNQFAKAEKKRFK